MNHMVDSFAGDAGGPPEGGTTYTTPPEGGGSSVFALYSFLLTVAKRLGSVVIQVSSGAHEGN